MTNSREDALTVIDLAFSTSPFILEQNAPGQDSSS